MYTVALCFRVYPLANVGFSICALPDAVSILDSLDPLTVINFAVHPLVYTLAAWFSFFVRSVIGCAIREDFIAAAVTLVALPFSLVNTPILVNKNAGTLSLTLFI